MFCFVTILFVLPGKLVGECNVFASFSVSLWETLTGFWIAYWGKGLFILFRSGMQVQWIWWLAIRHVTQLIGDCFENSAVQWVDYLFLCGTAMGWMRKDSGRIASKFYHTPASSSANTKTKGVAKVSRRNLKFKVLDVGGHCRQNNAFQSRNVREKGGSHLIS